MNRINDILAKCKKLQNKFIDVEYQTYQARDIKISKCLDYMSGSSNLAEEKNYQRLKTDGEKYLLLTGATTKEDSVVMLNQSVKVSRFENKEGLLVTRKGKAGMVRHLQKGRYTLNDDAYILYLKDNIDYEINLKWLAIEYKSEFLLYASNSDNGTWNMTGFFEHIKIDIPSLEERLSVVKKHDILEQRIIAIEEIEKHYSGLISKEIA